MDFKGATTEYIEMADWHKERTLNLAVKAWTALIQASPNANPDSLAVKAIDLAKSFYKVEEALFREDTETKKEGSDS
jgi:hypothetical protein